MWTQFWDMHSGGGQKEEWAQIFIEAPEDEARVIFYNRFDHNPNRITCMCCGEDYVVNEYKTLTEATAYQRNCPLIKKDGEVSRYHEANKPLPKGWHREKYYPKDGYKTVRQYEKLDDVLIIRKAEIKDEARQGAVPEQGYVWVD